jgi:putative transposase
MPRQKQEKNRTDELLDDLRSECHSPEDILGESGLLKQLSQRLIERALTGDLSHHLKSSMPKGEEAVEDDVVRRNSRNGYSKKTV